MKPYFEKKLGSTFKRWIDKGRRDGGTLGYFHLLAVGEDELLFSVSSRQITPSGIASAHGKRKYGEITVPIGKGLDDTLEAAVDMI